MSDRSGLHFINVPREIGNDDFATITEWFVKDSEQVNRGDIIARLETSKMAFDLEADGSGYIFLLAEVGMEVAVGAPAAVLSDSPEKPDESFMPSTPKVGISSGGDILITKKAGKLMEEHRIDVSRFGHVNVIREKDVLELMERESSGGEGHREETVGDDALITSHTGEENLHDVNGNEDFMKFSGMVDGLRREMKQRFNRHVPMGNLFNDRWKLASEMGYGENSSVYDDCLILGDVSVGENCWIGPFTVLDGYHARLVIGDYTSVGAGSQLYTHNTIELTLSGGKCKPVTKDTIIGKCCFIAPQVIISPGARIGDHCFIAAGSYVDGTFDSYSFIAGNPARRVGEVVMEKGNKRVKLKRFKGKE
ncbi:MAG: hypothetical protein GY940_27380 [bacterium]|nr:hypothetical protein [bacterium]